MNLKDNIILLRYEHQEIKLPIKAQEVKNDIQGTKM